jgi:flagellar hook protein FlgE
MYTAISSLNLHQNYLDVIANNLANANTTGYKSSRMIFNDQYSQMISPGASPSTTLGGVNPIQIGLGVKAGEITPVFTQGTMQGTGRDLDLAIQGDGFFVYDQGLAQRYSRDGALSVDADGYLVNSSTGLRAQGWMADSSGKVDTTLPPTEIKLNTDLAQAKTTDNVTFGGNLDSSTEVGKSVSASMGVHDALGTLRTANVTFTRTSATDWSWSVAATGTNDTATGSGTIGFTDGETPTITGADSIKITDSTGTQPAIDTKFDLSNLTQLSMSSSVSVTSQNGLAAGTVNGLYISPNDGTLSLVYSNGIQQQVAQLAIARFTNPSGLLSTGNTTYEKGLNSGDAQIGTANTGGRGSIISGSLEASNVDMAQEFTNMILAQRGFQASSRVITTSDSILQELVNLIR